MAGSSRPFGLNAPLGAWRTLDRWVTGYALATLPLLTYGWLTRHPGCGTQVLVNLAVLAGNRAVAWWSRDTRAAVPTVLRLFYAPIIYWAFYHQIAVLWPILWTQPLDGLLARADAALFHTQPSQTLRAALPYRWLSEVLCFAYLAYYFFTPVVGFGALLGKGYEAAERILLAATATFFCCYALFWLAPTVAPHFWFPPGSGPRLYDGYLFNHALFFFTGGGEIRGGAFPSSHIAVAVLYTLWARREVPALFPFLATVTALMLPAVVYLGAHYVLDVPAGLATGVLAYLVSARCLLPRR